MPDLPPIHEAIRSLAAGATQDDFAGRVGCSRGRVNRWMNGRETPGIAYLQTLVRIGLDPAYLLGEAAPAQAGRSTSARPARRAVPVRDTAHNGGTAA